MKYKCLNCESEFQQNSNSQKYCSKQCRPQNRVNYWKDYYASHRKQRLLTTKKSYIKTNCQQKRTKSGVTTYRFILERCNNPKNPSYCRYGAKGVKCLLTLEEFRNIYFGTDYCDICEQRLSDEHNRRGKSARTIDRIDSTGNYEIKNVRVVCKSCNSHRGALSTNRIRWQNKK